MENEKLGSRRNPGGSKPVSLDNFSPTYLQILAGIESLRLPDNNWLKVASAFKDFRSPFDSLGINNTAFQIAQSIPNTYPLGMATLISKSTFPDYSSTIIQAFNNLNSPKLNALENLTHFHNLNNVFPDPLKKLEGINSIWKDRRYINWDILNAHLLTFNDSIRTDANLNEQIKNAVKNSLDELLQTQEFKNSVHNASTEGPGELEVSSTLWAWVLEIINSNFEGVVNGLRSKNKVVKGFAYVLFVFLVLKIFSELGQDFEFIHQKLFSKSKELDSNLKANGSVRNLAIVLKNCHLREFPNKDSGSIMILNHGQEVKIAANSQGNWAFVEFEYRGNIYGGFVYRKYLNQVDTSIYFKRN